MYVFFWNLSISTDPIVPMYFYVPKEMVEYEKQEPGSQLRHASPEGTANNIFLWGQSMYIISQLLVSSLVHVNEIDLIRRYLPSFNRPRRAGRYSAFQVSLNFKISATIYSIFLFYVFIILLGPKSTLKFKIYYVF